MKLSMVRRTALDVKGLADFLGSRRLPRDPGDEAWARMGQRRWHLRSLSTVADVCVPDQSKRWLLSTKRHWKIIFYMFLEYIFSISNIINNVSSETFYFLWTQILRVKLPFSSKMPSSAGNESLGGGWLNGWHIWTRSRHTVTRSWHAADTLWHPLEMLPLTTLFSKPCHRLME